MVQGDAMLANHVAALLGELADHADFDGDNPYRVRALRKAASTTEKLGPAFEQHLRQGTLKSVAGFGPATLALVDELLRTGSVAAVEAARQRTPPVLLRMAALPGVGARKARLIHAELGIQELAELEYAALENRLVRIPGVGQGTQDAVLRAFRQHILVPGQCRLETADAATQALCASLRLLPGVVRADTAGAVRRRCEVVSRVEVLVAAADPALAVERALHQGALVRGKLLQPQTALFEAAPGVEGVLHAVLPQHHAAAWVWWTGGAEHVAALQPRLPVALTQDGADRTAEDEAAVYAWAGLPWIPPELRDDGAWLERAARQGVPHLVTLADLQGTLHNHTQASDGRSTMEDMQEAANALGYRYLGISEHSQSAHYARGLGPQALAQQQRNIQTLASLPGTRLLHGVESDILEGGNLDYPPEVLAGLEFVIASVHARFKQDATRMTQRLVKAVEHPAVDVLGHPTGRLLLGRAASTFDVDQVFSACARHGVAVEINGHPNRMDPEPALVARAVKLGARVLLSADAHSVDALAHVHFALDVARRAAVTAAEVVNAWPPAQMDAWLKRRRRHS